MCRQWQLSISHMRSTQARGAGKQEGIGDPMGRPTFNKFIVIRKGPTHCFRAILEWIINKKAPCFVQPHDTKRVQVGFADSFFWVQPVATFLFFNLARVRQSSDSE